MTAPRLSRLVLRVCAAREERAELLEEIEAEFGHLVVTVGVRTARRWYRRQTRRSVVPLLVERLRRRVSRTRSTPDVVSDVSSGIRNALRHGGLTALVVGTLAVAGGAALSATLVVQAVLLSPLGFQHPERIVRLWNAGPRLPAGVTAVSYQDLQDWRDRSATMDALSGYTGTSATLSGHGDPRRIDGMRVGRDFDRVLGLGAEAGRLLVDTDFAPGADAVVVLTDGFWRREFGGDPSIVGRTITLNDRACRVVGVLPRLRSRFPAEPYDFWVPLVPRQGAQWESARGTGWVDAVGRLAPGRTLAEATGELSGIARGLALEYPESNRERQAIEVERLRENLVGSARPALLLIAAATLGLLAVAFANVMHLLIGHAVGRRAEFAIRRALGAGRGRLAVQVLAEATLIAALSVGMALAVSPLMLRVLQWLPASAMPRQDEITLHTALWSSLALLTAEIVLIALPLLRSAARSSLPALTVSTRVTGLRADRRTRHIVVATQVAFSVALLLGGVLFVQTLRHLESAPLGFDAQHVLTLLPTPSTTAAPNAGRTLAFLADSLAAIRTVPGVTQAAASTSAPFVLGGWSFSVAAKDQPDDTRYLVGVAVVSPRFFETLGIRLVAGRWFTGTEHRDGASVTVINDRLAALLFGSAAAVGQSFEYSGRRWEVVGVAATTRTRVSEPGGATMYLPWKFAGQRQQTLIVRTTASTPVLDAVVERLRQLDPGVTVTNASLLTERVSRTIAPQRFRAALMGILSGLAGLLALVGAYGVTSANVAARQREHAIRLALGQSVADARRQAMGGALGPAAIGALAGLGAAWYASRFVTAFLFEVSVTDPRLLAVPLALLALVAIAAFVPSARIARLDPAMLLRGGET